MDTSSMTALALSTYNQVAETLRLRSVPDVAFRCRERLRHIAQWTQIATPNVSLDAIGLIALADLAILAERTALTGSSCYADVLVLAPGMHRQQQATTLHGGEYPICANINSGYVFRIENPATVKYLQSAGRTGTLTTLVVAEEQRRLKALQSFLDLPGSILSAVLYISPMLLTLFAFALFVAIQDHWAIAVLAGFVFARLLNVIVIRRRRDASWHGYVEEGKPQELLVLLSQDRWIRIRGIVDHLKTVTSGQWLRDGTFVEELTSGAATVIVYLAAALTSNATQVSKVFILGLFLANAGLVALSNGLLHSLQMKGFTISETGVAVKYARRLEMAHQLVRESKRSDWAVKMGMINEGDPVVREVLERHAFEDKVGPVHV